MSASLALATVALPRLHLSPTTVVAMSWNAPTAPDRPIDAFVTVPGSKSMTNRALVLAALANTPSTIVGALRSRDSDLMIAGLQAMGARIDEDCSGAQPVLRVVPGPIGGAEVDCGLAGTVMRFLPPVAALAASDDGGPACVRFDGDEQARKRPMGSVLGALRSVGVDVAGDALPFEVCSSGYRPQGGTVTIDASASSQFVSGLLLSGARYASGLEVRHSGGRVPSMPHIEMTVEMLRSAGVDVAVDGSHSPSWWRVVPGPIAGRQWVIEPDLSNATPFLAAAAVTGGCVTTPWPESTTQPGEEIRPILEAMGARVVFEACASGDNSDGVLGRLRVCGPSDGVLQGVEWDMSAIGELTPTVAALAAVASTPSHLYGIAHLRGHETDRLQALAAEINRLGGACEELDDGIRITPAPLHGGVWHSYADHRMATAGAIIGLKVDGVMVDDIETTSKTLPGFAGMWSDMLGLASDGAV